MTDRDPRLEQLIELATDPGGAGPGELDPDGQAELAAQRAVQQALSTLETPSLAPEERHRLHEAVAKAQREEAASRPLPSQSGRHPWLTRALPALAVAASLIVVGAIGINLLDSDDLAESNEEFATQSQSSLNPPAENPTTTTIPAVAVAESARTDLQETAPALAYDPSVAQPSLRSPPEEWIAWTLHVSQSLADFFPMAAGNLAGYAVRIGLACWENLPRLAEPDIVVVFAGPVEIGGQDFEAYHLTDGIENTVQVFSDDCAGARSFHR